MKGIINDTDIRGNMGIGQSHEEARQALKKPGKQAPPKRTLAYQIERQMAKKRMSRADMARLLGTSRAALNRLLDPENNSVTLQTLLKASSALGCRLVISLEENQP